MMMQMIMTDDTFRPVQPRGADKIIFEEFRGGPRYLLPAKPAGKYVRIYNSGAVRGSSLAKESATIE